MIFLNSASSAAVLVFDLALCIHTDTKGNTLYLKGRGVGVLEC